jgi:hypothetical protein
MATGWPMKTTYANGDVYSAGDVNDITGTINLLTSSTLSVAGGKNYLINGGMDIWQRGTSFASLTAASSSTFAADRWQVYIGNAGRTVSQQASGLTSFRYSMRVARDSGNTSTAVTQVTQNIESNMSYPLAGKTVTLSFYGKAGANYSAASGALTYALYQGTGIDQNVFGMTGGSGVGTGTATLTTSWQRFSFSVTVPTTSTELAVYFSTTPVGTAGANDWFEITGVQLELGSTATTFSRAGGTIQGELAACQRYYIRLDNQTANSFTGFGRAYNTTFVESFVSLPVPMRIYPTSMDSSNLAINNSTVNYNSGTFALNIYGQRNLIYVQYTHGSGVFTQSNMYNLTCVNGYIGFNAEL